MKKQSSNYYEGIDTKYIASRITSIPPNLSEVDTQLAVAESIFSRREYLMFVDGPFMMYDCTSGSERHPLSIRGHQIEIQSPDPKTVANAKSLQFGLGILGYPHYIVNTTPEADASVLVDYAKEVLPRESYELEYRLETQPDFHTSPLIVAHHRHEGIMNPFAEVRQGRFVLIDELNQSIETVAGTESEVDALKIMEAYIRHGISYKVSTVSPDEEIDQLWRSHHHKGSMLFRPSLF